LTAITFSEDQQEVLDAVLAWRARGPRGADLALTLGGYAGTGKSTLVAFLAGEWAGVAVAALCGKAAHVLRSKGVDAQTVHSLIYVPEQGARGPVRFRRRSALPGVGTLIIDEASMIGSELLADLHSFHIPIQFVGDHGQLEPIGASANLMADPHLRLETIHRQAASNPILRLAASFREGREVQRWEDPAGRLSVLGRAEFDDLVSPEVQILCGFNETRRRVNAQVRRMLGLEGELVAPGRS
jgi:exodeoxyribonuclease V